METDMSPFDDSITQQQPQRQDFFPPQQSFHQQQPQEFFPSYPQQYQKQESGFDNFFSSISKSTWIIIAILFIVGFFMGKTMQPVFIKTG